MMRCCVVAGVLAAVVVSVLPAIAGAQSVAPPYDLRLSGASLVASPAAGGSTLAVQVQATPTRVEFSPAAVTFPAGVDKCENASDRTICDLSLVATELRLDGDVLEVGVHGLSTPTLTLDGGPAADAVVVDGTAAPGAIGTVFVGTGAGADSVTVKGNVGAIGLLAPETGDDRYVIESPAVGGTLDLGDGNDVASSSAQGLTLAGGAGQDTLSGAGALLGGPGDDLLKPTGIDRPADGGAGGLDRLSFDLLATGLVLTKSGDAVQVQGGVAKSGIEQLEGGRGGDTLNGGAGPDHLAGGEGDDTIAGGGGGDVLDGGPGENTVSYASAAGPVTVDLAAGTASAGSVDTLGGFRHVVTGSGADVVTGTTANESFALGEGDDSLNAGPGNDFVLAGGGNDLVRGGHGTDVVDGGPGRDTATYDERTASEPVSVTLQTLGDDGAAGEADSLVGMEDVVGGASNDALVGDAGPNQLVGGPGLNTLVGDAGDDLLLGAESRDVIDGGAGRDQLFGEGDDDSINAFDGEADLVSCGTSADDDAQVDGADQVSGCEFARRGDVPVPIDADGDGIVAGFDCDDSNATIAPGATDLPNDRIDQDCDGFDESLPLAASGLVLRFAAPTRRGTRITRIVVTGLDAASTVVFTCTTRAQRRCPFRRATRRPRRGQVSLTSLLRRRVLPVGTRLEIRVTAAGTIGRVRRFTVRRSASPRSDDRLCLMPGSSVPRRCPDDVL